jgi:hypothetical protein
MNDQSSRSHAVFIIYTTQHTHSLLFDSPSTHDQIQNQVSQTHTQPNITNERLNNSKNKQTGLFRNKLCLVDLAGSERVKDSEVKGINLKETIDINTSLTTLGRVISTLSKQESTRKTDQFVPFRDSVLTWLLKDSLGGNSKTFMLATISPSHVNYDETLNTLQYASRAKQIVNKVSVNSISKDLIINKLTSEINEFKAQLENIQKLKKSQLNFNSVSLWDNILQRQKLLTSLNTSWNDRIKVVQNIHSYENDRRGEGKSILCPFLIDMSQNLHINAELIHYLRPGVNMGTTFHPELKCVFLCALDGIWLIPQKKSEVSVNGQVMFQKQLLGHGDRITIGTERIFKLKLPLPKNLEM